MLKKLKQKAFLAIIVFSLSLGLFPVFSAHADSTCGNPTNIAGTTVTCDLSQIQLKADTQVGGQNSNFVRVGEDGNLNFRVIVTLQAPASLTFIGTTIAVSGSRFPFGLNGVGAVVVPFDTSSACSTQKIYSTDYFSCNNSSFDSTPFNQTKAFSASQNFQANGVLLTQDFTIPASSFAKLGIIKENDGTDVNSGINQIYIYPELNASYTSDKFQNAFKPGISMYVQLYKTQAQATAAGASGQQPTACASAQAGQAAGQNPSCVPGYGSSTGSGTNLQSNPTTILSLITSIITTLLGIVNQFIYFLFYWLVAPLIQAILSIHVYTDAFVNVIYPGWEIVRNVCNILFIVAIIAMGMATLLRVESYQWRTLIVKLVIAALLVNFSLIIGQAILAFADTIQNQFLPNNVDVIRSLARDLILANQGTTLSQSTLGANVAYLTQYMFFVAMAIGSFLVFAAIAAFLVIRMVMLWVLLMLSPVAYVAGILPITESAVKKWWSMFIKYAFFTPIIAFFLNMTAVISNSSKGQLLDQINANNFGNTTAFAGSNNQDLSHFVFTVASNILLLVFLFAAIKVADMMGTFGGDVLAKYGQKGALLPFSYAGNKVKAKGQAAVTSLDTQRLKLANTLAPKDTDKWYTKPLKRVGFGLVAPGAVTAAKKEERESKQKEAKEMVGARAKDIVKPSGKAAEKLLLQKENEKVKKAQDTYANATETQVVAALNNAINKGDIVEFKALMKVATDEDYMGAVATGVGGGDINDVYRKMSGKMKSQDDINKVDKTRKQIDNSEAKEGRYQNMSNISTTTGGVTTPGARDNKLNSLSIEDMSKVNKDLYMTDGKTLTGTATTALKEIVTAMGSDPLIARDMIKKMRKSEKTALRTLLGNRSVAGAPVTARADTGLDSADANKAKAEFDRFVPNN